MKLHVAAICLAALSLVEAGPAFAVPLATYTAPPINLPVGFSTYCLGGVNGVIGERFIPCFSNPTLTDFSFFVRGNPCLTGLTGEVQGFCEGTQTVTGPNLFDSQVFTTTPLCGGVEEITFTTPPLGLTQGGDFAAWLTFGKPICLAASCCNNGGLVFAGAGSTVPNQQQGTTFIDAAFHADFGTQGPAGGAPEIDAGSFASPLLITLGALSVLVDRRRVPSA